MKCLLVRLVSLPQRCACGAGGRGVVDGGVAFGRSLPVAWANLLASTSSRIRGRWVPLQLPVAYRSSILVNASGLCGSPQ